MDNIKVLQQLIDRCNEYELSLCLAFVGYKKAFDSIKLSSLFDAIEKQSIEPSYINLLRSIYTNATATIGIYDTPVTIKLEKAYVKAMQYPQNSLMQAWKKYLGDWTGQKQASGYMENI